MKGKRKSKRKHKRNKQEEEQQEEEDRKKESLKGMRTITPTQIKHTLTGTYTIKSLECALEENPQIVPTPKPESKEEKEETPSLSTRYAHQVTDEEPAEYEVSAANIAAQQREDPILSEVIRNCLLETSHASGDYLIQGEVLLKKKDSLKDASPANTPICIPDRLLPSIIGHAHVALGHAGITRTTLLLTSGYNHPELRK